MNTKAGLIAHWPLADNGNERVANGLHATNHGVTFDGGAAEFNGRDAFLEIPDQPELAIGHRPMTLSAWIKPDTTTTDTTGDIIAKFDRTTRRGFSLSVSDHYGVTHSQANRLNLQFGIDDGSEPQWHDCGRPGHAVSLMSMAVHKGELYVGTFVLGANETGDVYRYASGKEWESTSLPNQANCVSSLTSHGDRLYAACGYYDSRGSALGEPGNSHRAHRVYVLEADGTWNDCGAPETSEDMWVLAMLNGTLYASPLWKPGFYRYEGRQQWTACATPVVRQFALCPYRGHLYLAANRSLLLPGPQRRWKMLDDADGVYRYDADADQWIGCGQLEEESQMYSFAVYGGELHVGTWPNGKVFRMNHRGRWRDAGRLHPEEKEVMAMAVYNGMLYAGTLPAADVYRYDDDHQWTRVGATDTTPNVKYRRAWSMAVHHGRLFVGTLPSGHAWAMTAGRCATDSHALDEGWRHVLAARDGDRVALYRDGRPCGASPSAESRGMDLTNTQPLRIGFGPRDYFRGSIADVRLYNGALTAEHAKALYARGRGPTEGASVVGSASQHMSSTS